MQDGLVLCEVKSWMTGRRLVSLPFSDHCDPLVDSSEALTPLVAALQRQTLKDEWRYIEMRPLHSVYGAASLFQSTKTYVFHQLDLSPDLSTLFHNFHKNSTQRKIRRAEREKLIYQEGQSEFLLEHFYRLFVLTRRRHGIPPQPQKWFRNLVESFGDALKIRVAFQGSRSVASILTLRYKNTLTYKYGCSDTHYNNLGGTQLLFWQAICEAKEQGLRTFDLGRSDSDDTGLITFKDRWGATRSTLTYFRYFVPGRANASFGRTNSEWRFKIIKRVFEHMPSVLLSATGRMLYKHMG